MSQTAGHLAEALARHLGELRAMPTEALLAGRYKKFRCIGHLESAPT
jgi:acetyl-CoA carboxylase alpha subunit